MKNHKHHIYNLLIEKISGYTSAENERIIQKYLEEDEEVKILWERIQEKHASGGENFFKSLDEDQAWENIKHNIVDNKKVNTNYKRWLSVAALIMAIVAGSYYFNFKTTEKQNETSSNLEKKHNAIQLKLADGRSISLDKSGDLDIGIAKLNVDKGKLGYKSDHASSEWNTLSVPVKMDYNLTLSDGTEVWLNSASDFRFPFNFIGDKREVYLSGEAYFKVAKDVMKPFIVHTGGTEIKVLGTAFNINNYDGHVVTSLVEGSVLNIAGDHKMLLKPGYQSIYQRSTGFLEKRFDPEAVLSWREGVYYLDNVSLKEMSDIIYRWFDIKVVIDNPDINQLTFTGSIQKDKSLNIFINNLEISAGIKTQMINGELHLK